MCCNVAVSVLLCLLTLIPSCSSDDKVKLTEVQVLTFRQGLYTTSRRSHSVPQLNCRGGSAGCIDQPTVIECYNRGTSGQDVQWDCKAEMNKSQELGTTQVKCEGYDNPQDEYLEYTLEEKGCDDCSNDDSRGQKGPIEDRPTASALPSAMDFLNAIYLILAVIGTCVVCTCCCALLCPEKSDKYKLSGVVLQDKEGNQKVVNIPPRKQGTIEEVEVVRVQRVSSSTSRN
ncbi:hypothetical protein MTO96_010252 [Rhipicephalus appendiculatus]